ncbi:hypothetical protein OSB04_023169 [Centaurea solstitialis]|uniref:GRF-type domain-containing protein n=1 Tax=Centaurea solstitialis TaxID=347529 RepID=A0AA38T252_9ASTR|nr:hypothetical protein OSB04_023169 [Centaurea solstitialis]
MVTCPCGADAIIRTSWTTSNPGRRFYCCSRTVRCCGFICWMDQPLDSRSIDVVRGLLRSKKNIEEAYAVAVQESRILKIILAFSWILFVIMELWDSGGCCTPPKKIIIGFSFPFQLHILKYMPITKSMLGRWKNLGYSSFIFYFFLISFIAHPFCFPVNIFIEGGHVYFSHVVNIFFITYVITIITLTPFILCVPFITLTPFPFSTLTPFPFSTLIPFFFSTISLSKEWIKVI